MSRKYIIINTSELASLDFSKLLTTSADTARRNNANNKAIVSYDGTAPSELSGKTEYDNSEIITIVNDPSNGWTEQ